MIIKQAVSYTIGNGVEFKSLDDAKVHVENRLGEIIEMVEPRLTPKQALHLLSILDQNKHKLIDLLGTVYIDEEDYEYSILDYGK